MSKQELQNKIDRYVDHIYSDDPEACVNMKRVFKLLTDEMDRFARSIAPRVKQ